MKSHYFIRTDVNDSVCRYVAGFFDGEGSVSICKKKSRTPNGKTTYELSTGIGNTNKEVEDWVAEAFGATCYLKERKSKQNKNWHDFYNIELHGDNAVRFLTQIKPYLIVKKRQAELAIKFQELVNTGSRLGGYRVNGINIGGNYLNDNDRNQREQIYLEMLKLNKRGKRKVE